MILILLRRSDTWWMICAAALFTMILATAASAHSWYPSSCCSGSDCKPMPGEFVQENGNEFVVYVPQGWPGASPFLPPPVIHVPHSKVIWTAPDGGFHACPIIYTGGPQFRCFFAPPRET